MTDNLYFYITLAKRVSGGFNSTFKKNPINPFGAKRVFRFFRFQKRGFRFSGFSGFRASGQTGFPGFQFFGFRNGFSGFQFQRRVFPVPAKRVFPVFGFRNGFSVFGFPVSGPAAKRGFAKGGAPRFGTRRRGPPPLRQPKCMCKM